MTDQEMSAIFKGKKSATELLRSHLCARGIVDPSEAVKMLKVDLLLAAAEAHNKGLLNVRDL